MHSAANHPPPLHAAPPSLFTPAPPATPTPKTPRSQTANAAQRGLRPPPPPLHNCHLTSEERPNSDARSLTPPPAVPWLLDTRPSGAPDFRCSRATAPLPAAHHLPPRPTHTPPGPASGTVTCSLKNLSRSPLRLRARHQPPRAGFSKPVNLTLTPLDRSLFPRPDYKWRQE